MRNCFLLCCAALVGLLVVPTCNATADDAELNQAIEQHRKGTLTVQAPPGAAVRVEQMRHEFWFGAALSSGPFSSRANAQQATRYKQVFLEYFNAAVTENALKWHSMERPGARWTTRPWTRSSPGPSRTTFRLRGHNIFWGIPNRVQDWLKALSDDELREVLKARAMDIGKRYRGRFAEYDLNNEMIHGNYYEERLGPDITLQMANWVRQGDAEAVLYLNDYDILTGVRLDDYCKQIRTLLGQGVPIGGIGVQGHLHGDTFDPKALSNALEKLSRVQSADPRHRVQHARPAVAVSRRAEPADDRGRSRPRPRTDGVLPDLFCPPRS